MKRAKVHITSEALASIIGVDEISNIKYNNELDLYEIYIVDERLSDVLSGCEAPLTYVTKYLDGSTELHRT